MNLFKWPLSRIDTTTIITTPLMRKREKKKIKTLRHNAIYGLLEFLTLFAVDVDNMPVISNFLSFTWCSLYSGWIIMIVVLLIVYVILISVATKMMTSHRYFTRELFSTTTTTTTWFSIICQPTFVYTTAD